MSLVALDTLSVDEPPTRLLPRITSDQPLPFNRSAGNCFCEPRCIYSLEVVRYPAEDALGELLMIRYKPWR